MKKIQTIRCTSCGSAQVESLGNGIGKCSHCQSTMLLPKQNEEIISLLNAAHVYRENFNYDLAIKSYQYILEKDPQELSAYEGILLSEYGIEYVKDSYSNKLIPTCHRAHFKSILEDDNYKALISLADENQIQVIEQKAKEIDKLQKAIERQLQNEESYDIFISYKATDKNGDKTEDSLIARNIYEELTNKNYKVFFSEKSLEDRLGSEYEPIIFKALHTSKIFILVGTSKENIESTWVRNEWSRFIDRIKNEPQTLSGNNFIPIFKNMNPYDFPKINNNFVQGVDANKLGYSITVLDGVQKILKPEKEKKVLDTFDNIDNIEQFEKIRKQRIRELKEKKWKDFNSRQNSKNKKFFYNLFLYSPYIFSLICFCMLLSRKTLFLPTPQFTIFCSLLFLDLVSVIITVSIHKRKFFLKPLINVVLPYIIIVILITIFILSFIFLPVTLSGLSPLHFTDAKYYKGLIYTPYSSDAIHIRNNANLDFFTKKVNGEKHLIIPEKINNKIVAEISDIYIEEDINVLVLPVTYSRQVFIRLPKNHSLKDVYISKNKHIAIFYYNDGSILDGKIENLFYISTSENHYLTSDRSYSDKFTNIIQKEYTS